MIDESTNNKMTRAIKKRGQNRGPRRGQQLVKDKELKFSLSVKKVARVAVFVRRIFCGAIL